MNTALIVIVIIILIILFIYLVEYLMKVTIRKKRLDAVLALAQQSKKPLLIINKDSFSIDGESESITPEQIESMLEQMKAGSMTIVANQILEYVPDVDAVISQLRRVSGGDLYTVNLENGSPKLYYDPYIIQKVEEPYTLPNDPIDVLDLNSVQINLHRLTGFIVPK